MSEAGTLMATTLRPASREDLPRLLTLMAAFNATQDLPFDEARTRTAIETFLKDPALGRIWLICPPPGPPAGYLVLAFGFSFEYGGRDAILDEIYLEPTARGRGHGREALELALTEARSLGLQAIHLEVERANPKAQKLYRQAGFLGNERQLLSLRL